MEVRAREADLGAVGVCGRDINKRDVTLILPSGARSVLILNIFLGLGRVTANENDLCFGNSRFLNS